nr:hypothetical protein BaRGS_030780 [Batillaria attramentaria]
MEKSQKQNFLIDGFPRNKDNLDGWNHVMNSVARVQRVIFFNCPEDVCVNRCLDRGKTSGRTDDNLESLKKRIQTYYESTMPIIEHYRKQNLVAEINANQTLDELEMTRDDSRLFVVAGSISRQFQNFGGQVFKNSGQMCYEILLIRTSVL